MAKFISDRLLHDGGLKLSTRKDFPTWNDSIMSTLTYARVHHYIDLPSPQSTVECPMDSLGSTKSTEIAPGTFDADIDQLICESIRETLIISLRPNYSHYTTAATLYAALVHDFGEFGPEQLYSKVCALVDTVCTANTDIATWLGTMGSLARDLTAMELTVDKLL
ncbi:hypothetical protein C365_04209, partial [Cryptococcus neoformans Bt85]